MSVPSLSDIGLDKKSFDEFVQVAFDVLSDGKVTFGEVVQLGGLLAGKVNQLSHLSGLQKQKVVLEVVDVALKRVVSEVASKLPEAERPAFQEKVDLAASFARETLPDVLDVAVQAAKGQIDLGKAKKTCWTAVKLLFRCAGRPVPQVPTALVAKVEEVADKAVVSVATEAGLTVRLSSVPETTVAQLPPSPKETLLETSESKTSSPASE
jgi:hypothetical protein